ncbi:MAG: DNA alkylation repair protein [Alphaproteobacteria bacterium]|nr:MAG: DNA alkylation repair protein [Alphaproteobacteria bacterium]
MPNAKLTPIFLRQLQKHKNATHAKWDKAYHKSSRTHWGVRAAFSKQVVKDTAQKRSEEELLTLAKDLWATDQFDAMIAATRILCLPQVKPSKKLWQTIKQFLKDVDGWALQDNMAPAAWKCILADEKLLDELNGWTEHPNFWMRRAVLVYTLPYAKLGRNPERMLDWAGQYADDEEWFIQKAIGWWLRDLGSHNSARVIEFLNAYNTQLKYVAKHEATRKLKPEWRKKIKQIN